jgi:hypothetical protein
LYQTRQRQSSNDGGTWADIFDLSIHMPMPNDEELGNGGGKSSPVQREAAANTKYYLVLGFWMMSWYITSLCTLFMNKIILSTPGGDKYVLGVTQMCMTAALGAVKVRKSLLAAQHPITLPRLASNDHT